jgi:hypothetical protein
VSRASCSVERKFLKKLPTCIGCQLRNLPCRCIRASTSLRKHLRACTSGTSSWLRKLSSQSFHRSWPRKMRRTCSKCIVCRCCIELAGPSDTGIVDGIGHRPTCKSFQRYTTRLSRTCRSFGCIDLRGNPTDILDRRRIVARRRSERGI